MQNTITKIPFGLRDGVMLCIEDVPSGLKCGCVCPSCGEQLQAKKGTLRVHHFAHSNTACNQGFETSLHRMAKQIIKEDRFLYIKKEEIIESARDIKGIIRYESAIATPFGDQKFKNIEVEKKILSIRPDLFVHTDSESFCIEITVTNSISKEKKGKLKGFPFNVLEIDLSTVNRDITKDQLKYYLLKTAKYQTKWIHIANEKTIRLKLTEKLNNRINLINSRFTSNEFPSTDFKPHKGRLLLKKKDQKNTSYNSVWLRCDNCTHVWCYSKEYINYLPNNVSCPSCLLKTSTVSCNDLDYMASLAKNW